MNIYFNPAASGQTEGRNTTNKKLENSGIPADVIAQGEGAIQKYAAEHHINLASIQDKVEKKDDEKLSLPPKTPPASNTGSNVDFLA